MNTIEQIQKISEQRKDNILKSFVPEIKKARPHKYIRKEGSRYIYEEPKERRREKKFEIGEGFKYGRDFEKWVNKEDIKIVNSMKGFKSGQEVIYTNDYGVKFDSKILGFREKENSYGGVVYLDKDSYWYAVPLNQIKKRK